MHRTQSICVLLVSASLVAAGPVRGATPEDLVGILAKAARDKDPHFAGFSSQRGRQLFTERREVTSPLAPAADPKRFTDLATAEEWFQRNCNDVLGRDCTTQEKGDVLTYLISVNR